VPVLTGQGAQTTKKPNETSTNVTPDTETFVTASLTAIRKRSNPSVIAGFGNTQEGRMRIEMGGRFLLPGTCGLQQRLKSGLGLRKEETEDLEAYGAREKATAVQDKWLITVLGAVRLLRLRLR